MKKMIDKQVMGNTVGTLDEKLVHYRENRPAKTTGNPYRVLGEPIGDMRDNMGCRNFDLCTTQVTVRSAQIAGVPVRIYACEHPKKDRACLLFIHGGSFIGGSVQVMENPCRFLAEQSGALVISIDYRLAPEHAYPAGLMDCLAVLDEVYEQQEYVFDRSRLAVGGDSAGANLAIGCAVREMRERDRVAFALLFYPVTDVSGCHPSWRFDLADYRDSQAEMPRQLATGLIGLEEQVEKLYLQGRISPKDGMVSPLYLADVSHFPKTMLFTAEYDYLRPQGEAFFQKLAEAGAEVTGFRYEGVGHSFMEFTGILDQSRDCLLEAAAGIRGI